MDWLAAGNMCLKFADRKISFPLNHPQPVPHPPTALTNPKWLTRQDKREEKYSVWDIKESRTNYISKSIYNILIIYFCTFPFWKFNTSITEQQRWSFSDISHKNYLSGEQIPYWKDWRWALCHGKTNRTNRLSSKGTNNMVSSLLVTNAIRSLLPPSLWTTTRVDNNW